MECLFGICDVCGKETYLMRTYKHYSYACKCHSPNHFELMIHCKDCETKVMELLESTNGQAKEDEHE